MIETIKSCGIVPVIKLSDIEKSEKLADALQNGGINCAEITFRAAGSNKVIERMLRKYPDMIVGAGTVLTLEEAELAVAAGAKFIVSPGLNEEVVEYSLKHNVLPIPGCITPTEIQKALSLGLKLVKFFPAEQFGGIKTIKALAAPFSQVTFMPTGGISLNNLKEYISEKAVSACGGTFMVKEDLITGEEWEKITEMSQKAVDIINESRK